MTELCDPQDDDGFTPFMRKFLFRNFCSTFLLTGVSVNEVKTWLPFYSFLGKDVQVRRLNLSKRNISGEQKHPPRKKQIFQLFFNHFSFDGRMCSLTSKKIKNNLRWESLEFWTLLVSFSNSRLPTKGQAKIEVLKLSFIFLLYMTLSI